MASHERYRISESGMTDTFCVYFKVNPGRESEFLSASRLNQAGARREAGNRRFDIFRSRSNPSHFLFATAYDSEDSAIGHRQSQHFLTWLETVTPLLEEPRQRVPGNDVPSDYEAI
jgi:autoinducer 2-degrading protein